MKAKETKASAIYEWRKKHGATQALTAAHFLVSQGWVSKACKRHVAAAKLPQLTDMRPGRVVK